VTGVTLTNAGDRFFQQAREGFAHLDRASRTAATAGRGEMGQLRIGILSSIGAGFLRDLMQSFSEAHSDVAIQIHEGGSADHISLVRKRQLDIAFVPDTSEAGDCDVAPLWREHLFVVLPDGHALTHCKVIEWRSLRNQPLIIRQSNCSSALCERLVKHLSDRARTAILRKVDVGRETVMHLVAMGRGVSLTSEATIATPFPGVVFRPLAGVDATLQFSAVWWPKNGDPAFRRFLSVARALAKKTRQPSNHGMA
jgi:DNA-binding transcriptional LysR family regulator